jgi:hypothetical protein
LHPTPTPVITLDAEAIFCFKLMKAEKIARRFKPLDLA